MKTIKLVLFRDQVTCWARSNECWFNKNSDAGVVETGDLTGSVYLFLFAIFQFAGRHWNQLVAATV